jgi:transposase
MRIAVSLELSDKKRTRLVRWSKGRSTPARLVLRANILLAAAKGIQNKDIAARLGTTRKTVGEWRARFAAARCAGLEKDVARGGRPATRRDQVARQIVEATTKTKPTVGTHWSTRTLAKQLGVSRMMVQRV